MQRVDRNFPSRALALAALLIAGIGFSAAAQAGEDSGPALDKALAGDHRSADNKARDSYRHPKATMAFFGLEPDMTVIEISPGGGWYTEVLAPVLKDHGKLIAIHAALNGGAYGRRSLGGYLSKLGQNGDVYDKVEVVAMETPDAIAQAGGGQADMVLTFRNVHNWMNGGTAQAMFDAMHKALKPGGVLGVVEHRAPKTMEDPKGGSGYVSEAQLIALAEKAGFKLAAKSEINANPKDNADHPRGVWTLPPTYALGDKDRAKYQAIGESDRMTMKFVKPAM